MLISLAFIILLFIFATVNGYPIFDDEFQEISSILFEEEIRRVNANKGDSARIAKVKKVLSKHVQSTPSGLLKTSCNTPAKLAPLIDIRRRFIRITRFQPPL